MGLNIPRALLSSDPFSNEIYEILAVLRIGKIKYSQSAFRPWRQAQVEERIFIFHEINTLEML